LLFNYNYIISRFGGFVHHKVQKEGTFFVPSSRLGTSKGVTLDIIRLVPMDNIVFRQLRYISIHNNVSSIQDDT